MKSLHLQILHVGLILCRFAPRDPNDNRPIAPIVRPKPPRKPRKPPVNPKSTTKSPPIRKPRTKKEKQAAEALHAATRTPISKMSESQKLVAESAEQNMAASELEPPTNVGSWPPPMEDDYSYLPNGQVGFDHFDQNLEHMNDYELNGYTNRVEHDNRVGMQKQNNQPTHGHMDIGAVHQGEAQSATLEYGQPMQCTQQDLDWNAWGQGDNEFFDLDVDCDFNNMGMPPVSDPSARSALENESFNQANDQSHLNNGAPYQSNYNQQGEFDNIGGQFGNNAQEPWANAYQPSMNYPTPHYFNNQNHNAQNPAPNQGFVATMSEKGNNYSLPFNYEALGQHDNNVDEEGPDPRDRRNSLASSMRELAGGPLNASFHEPQPLKVLPSTFKPGFPGILRGSNDEPASGRFNAKSAEKRARECQSPTPKSSGKKRRRLGSQSSDKHRQDRRSKTDSERRASFAANGNRKLDFEKNQPTNSAKISTADTLASKDNIVRSPSDTIEGSDDSQRSYLRVSTENNTNINDRYSGKHSRTHKPKQASSSNSIGGSIGPRHGNALEINTNGQEQIGNDGRLTMKKTPSFSIRNGRPVMEPRNTRPGNELKLQQSRQPSTMTENKDMKTSSGSLGNGLQSKKYPKSQQPDRPDTMDSRRSMSIPSDNVGNAQQARKNPHLRQRQRTSTINSDRSMSMTSGSHMNGQPQFEPPRNMPNTNQRVGGGQNIIDRLQRPENNFGGPQSMNSFPGNPAHYMANGGFGDPSMVNPGWGYHNGMPAMQNRHFPMFNQQQHPQPRSFPGPFGPLGSVGNMQGSWGCPPGMMLVPMNQFPPHMNYGGIHPSQLNFGVSAQHAEMMNRSQYQDNTRLGFIRGNQDMPPIPQDGFHNVAPFPHDGFRNVAPISQDGFRNVGMTRYMDQGSVPNGPYANGWNPNHLNRLQAEPDPFVEGTATSHAAHALVKLQHGRAEEKGRRHPNAPLNTANDCSVQSPREPLLKSTASGNVIQPTPHRTPAASASIDAILATTSSGSQDAQGQGQGSQQVARPPAVAAEYSGEDGEFEWEDKANRSYAFQG